MEERNLPQFSFLSKIINGGIAGIVGVACVFPLDLVKTRLQNQPIGPGGEKMYCSIHYMFLPYNQFEFCKLLTVDCLCQEKSLRLTTRMLKISLWPYGPMAIVRTGTIIYEVLKHHPAINRMDAFKKTYKAEGISGLYRGSGITIIFIIPEKATVLAANDYFRYQMQTKERNLPVYRQMIAGGLAGLCQIILTTPTELLKIRMQDAGRAASQVGPDSVAVHKKSARDLAMEIIKQNGIFGLYRGLSATMARDVTFSMIFYPLFATLNALGPKRAIESDESVFWWSFLSGYISGSFSALLVTPFDVVKTRTQALRKANSEILCSGIGNTLLNILRTEGPRALFKGGACRMLVIAPIFGITQAVYYIGMGEYLLGITK